MQKLKLFHQLLFRFKQKFQIFHNFRFLVNFTQNVKIVANLFYFFTLKRSLIVCGLAKVSVIMFLFINCLTALEWIFLWHQKIEICKKWMNEKRWNQFFMSSQVKTEPVFFTNFKIQIYANKSYIVRERICSIIV